MPKALPLVLALSSFAPGAHGAPSPDFTRLGFDTLLGGAVYVRARTRRVDLLASRGDQTGMWMLDFPFPYHRPDVGERFRASSRLLADALGGNAVPGYRAARRALREALDADSYRYFAFQLWQEGIARYTEYQVAKAAASGYEPSADFAALTDFTPYAQVAEAIHARILGQLAAADLAGAQRSAFYAYGAAEGLLLDSVSPDWRRRYLVEKFDLAPYYPPSR